MVGFLTGLIREKDFYVEIVATSPEYLEAKKTDPTRRGVGLMLVKEAMKMAKAHGWAVAACIRASNEGSKHLFAKAAKESERSFVEVKEEDDEHEDVLLSDEAEAHFAQVEKDHGKLVSYTMPLK
jgi:L-amino acid N-acyltransferase YncA